MTAALTVSQLAAAVRSGDLASERAVSEALDRVQRARHLGAVLALDRDSALAAAREQDRKRHSGADPGPLAGVPIAIKDNLCTRDLDTTCGSRMLEGWRPPYDATAVWRLRAAGAVIIAKTSCDEFGMGASTETCAFGPARHPLDPGRVPGGSSGGSAVVVADRQCPAALGSDTGGSVRQPASLCGVVGFKPSYGRISRFGLVAFASSLDQVGTLTRSVDDAALLLSVLAGPDPADATTRREPWRPAAPGGDRPRIGLLTDMLDHPDLVPAARAGVELAARVFREAGCAVRDVSFPEARWSMKIYHLLATCEASSNLARFDGVRYGFRSKEVRELTGMYERTRGTGFGREVKRRILLGTFALSEGHRDAWYDRARHARTRLCAAMGDLWKHCDILLAPTTPGPAFALGERLDDPVAMYASDVFTTLANVTGLPAVSLPAPEGARQPRLAARLPDGEDPAGVELPVGTQLLAPAGEDGTLLLAARMLESGGFLARG